MDPTLYVTNHSTLITDDQVALVAAACSIQLARDAGPLYDLSPVPVVFTKAPQRGYKTLDVVDVQDDPNALGWHTSELDNHLYGVSSIKPLLDNGCKLLTGANSASSVISHELLEMWADKFCQLFADNGRGIMIAYEIGDPVQSYSYDIPVSGQLISVSDFVTQEWFNPNAARTDRFDFLGKVRSPFTLGRGGYWVQERTGRQIQKLGRLAPEDNFLFDYDVPEWLREHKRNGHGRGARRLKSLGS